MVRKRALPSSQTQAQELAQPGDPLGSLPNTCIYAVLEHFTIPELIGMQRVSRGWKEAIDWRLRSTMRKSRPDLTISADEEQAYLEFRRAIFCQEARRRGRAVFVKRITHATRGFAVCGDFFCWVNNTSLNTQLVFNRGIAGRTAQVKRYALAGLLGAKGFSISIEVIKPQEPGCITDRPLLMINYAEKRREGPSAQDELVNPRMAIICVKSGVILWSTTHGKDIYPPAPLGNLVTLNHTTLAYIAPCPLGSMICMRDVLTGEVKATKPIPESLLPFPTAENALIQLHPRRDLAYIAVPQGVFFFSATTANCVGRLSAAAVTAGSRIPHLRNPNNLMTLYFSEHEPNFNPSARERFFVCERGRWYPVGQVNCFEYEIPTAEDISISEAKIIQDGGQASTGSLIFKVVRVQIFVGRSVLGPPNVNPMLKQSARTRIDVTGGERHTRIVSHSFSNFKRPPGFGGMHRIFPELGKPHDESIPLETCSPASEEVFITIPKRASGRLTKHDERIECNLPGHFLAPVQVMLTERYMTFSHQRYVYLFGYEPGW